MSSRIEMPRPTRDECEARYKLLRAALGLPPYTQAQIVAQMYGKADPRVDDAIVFIIGDYVRNWIEAEDKKASETGRG